MILHDNLIKRCLNAIFYGVGGAIGSRLLMVFTSIAISRILGEEHFGQYSFINNTVNLFVTFSGLGMTSTLIRYISASKGDVLRQGIYIKTLSCVCAFFAVILSFLMFWFSENVSLFVCGSYELAFYFKMVSIAIFFASMANVEQGIMVGFEEFKVSSIIQLLRCTFFFVISLFLTIKYGLIGSVYAIVGAHILCYIIALYKNILYYRKEGVILDFAWDNDIKNTIINFSMPAFISSLFVLPVNWVCNAMLIGSSGFIQMAYFSVAQQWMTYITYVPSQLGQLRPIYTDLLINKKINELRKIVSKTTLITTELAFGVAIVITFFNEYILAFYGDGYYVSKETFIVMLFTAVVYTAQVQTGFIIQAAGRMWLGFLINGIWGFSVILLFYWLQEYESLGCAYSYFISYTIILFIQYVVYNEILCKANANGGNE